MHQVLFCVVSRKKYFTRSLLSLLKSYFSLNASISAAFSLNMIGTHGRKKKDACTIVESLILYSRNFFSSLYSMLKKSLYVIRSDFPLIMGELGIHGHAILRSYLIHQR